MLVLGPVVSGMGIVQVNAGVFSIMLVADVLVWWWVGVGCWNGSCGMMPIISALQGFRARIDA